MMRQHFLVQKFLIALTGWAIALLLALVLPLIHPAGVHASSPPAPGRNEVCAIVTTMPGASSTDEVLTLLDTNRAEIISDLTAMKSNMEQYDAEKYGWTNVIDDPGALEPRPNSWLIGALRMACESQQMATVSGSVTYLQRIALPPEATLIVRLEDVSRVDAPSVLIAEQIIETAGKQVPIPFTLTYDPAQIVARNRYVVRAQIFYGDQLRWTSTIVYPVITQNNPTEAVEILLEQVGN